MAERVVSLRMGGFFHAGAAVPLLFVPLSSCPTFTLTKPLWEKKNNKQGAFSTKKGNQTPKNWLGGNYSDCGRAGLCSKRDLHILMR